MNQASVLFAKYYANYCFSKASLILIFSYIVAHHFQNATQSWDNQNFSDQFYDLNINKGKITSN